MKRAALMIGGLLTVVSVAAAQEPATVSPAKFETLAYENALRTAVMQAGQKLAQQAAVLVPEVTLEAVDQPIVRGVKLPDYGFFFDVQAPNIWTSIAIWGMVQQSRPARGPSPNIPVSGRTQATAMTVSDPMTSAPEAFDPTKAYSGYVKDALVDAMLDFSNQLSITAGERLTIVVNGVDQPNANQLYRPIEQKGIFTFKGSDLLEYRQGKITRDQAKQRITKEPF